MTKALLGSWLASLLVCLLLAQWHVDSWREFARLPARTVGHVSGYTGNHSEVAYQFWVGKESFRGTGRGDNLVIGSGVEVFYHPGKPSINSMQRPGEPVAYARKRFVDYVGQGMLWVSLALVLIYQFGARSSDI